MTGSDALIVGAVLIDNLIFADGSERRDVPGGAGLYALAGAALFAEAPVLVTGTGADLDETFGPWMARNGLSTRGLRIADAHAPRNVLRYVSDGTRTETPVFGQSHFSRVEPQAADLAPFTGSAGAIYVFRNADGFWEDFSALQFAADPVVLWEVALDACFADNLDRVLEIAGRVDALSLNLEEARLLVGNGSEDELIARLLVWPVDTIFLRAGARGSHVLHRGGAQFVPSLPIHPVDVTGGGNAYCGGALIGMMQNRSPLESAAIGTVAASLAIAQYGPPDTALPAIRAAAGSAVDRVLSSVTNLAAS